jgi:hypothetical protein
MRTEVLGIVFENRSEYISLFLCAVMHIMVENEVPHEKSHAVNRCSDVFNVRSVGYLTPLYHLEMLFRSLLRAEND